MFYLHHAFVDYLWEQFRKKQQSREQRQTQWAQDTCNELHGYDEQMKPFRLQNRDGLSNQYTDEWYDYEPVRHCMSIIPECDSPYYWCDTKSWRCRSKVVLGGNCTGFEGTGICYNSVCQQNRCQLPPRIQQSMRLRKSIDSIPGEIVWTKSLLVDQNGDGMNNDLAQIKITNPLTSETYTAYQEGVAYFPEINGTVYLPVPKPRAGIIQEVTLEARDAYGRYCQAHCYNTTEERYQVCQPRLQIGVRPETSSPLSYTHSMSSRRFLDVDLTMHPRQIVVSTPYIVFACSRRLMTSAMVTSLAKKTQPPQSREPHVWFRVTVHHHNSENLQIEAVPSSGDVWLSSVRKATSPFDANLVFVQAPNPELSPSGVQVRVSILEGDTRIRCSVKCTMKDGSTHECDGTVNLHSEPYRSDEDVFTSDQRAVNLLGWNMRGHPAQWRHKIPYLTFYC